MRTYKLDGTPEIKNQIVPAMPYMGSKRKLATKILNAIYETIGDFDLVYDCFGGGGAFSSAALIAGHRVVYNELNKGVAGLMRHILDGGEIPKTWVSREDFHKHKGGDDWYAGLVKSAWSFGNNQRDYLFGKNIERIKKLGHDVVINKDKAALAELSEYFGIYIPMPESRKEFTAYIRKEAKSRHGELQQLQRLQQLAQLEQLQQLQRLEQLERLERLERLEIVSGSYDELKIDNGGIVYCDPPYAGTKKYQEELDHDRFYDWCRLVKNPVFISGYDAPNDFSVVAEFEHRSTLSSTANNRVCEKLFWNGKRI